MLFQNLSYLLGMLDCKADATETTTQMRNENPVTAGTSAVKRKPSPKIA